MKTSIGNNPLSSKRTTYTSDASCGKVDLIYIKSNLNGGLQVLSNLNKRMLDI